MLICDNLWTKKAVDKIICGNLWIKRLWIKNPQGCRTMLADGEERYLAESNCSTRFCRPLPNRSAKVPCCLFAGAKVQQKNEITKYFCYFFHFFIANARNHPLLTDNPVKVCSSYRDTSDGCCRVGQCCTSTLRHAHSAGAPCNSWGLASPSLPNR